MFRIQVHDNVLISLVKNHLKNHFDMPNATIRLYHNNEELLDIKTVSSYNIKYNINVDVKGNDAKTLADKDKLKDKHKESS